MMVKDLHDKRFFRAAAGTLALLFVSSACFTDPQTIREMERSVDVILDVLQEEDREGFDDFVSKEIAHKTNEREFKSFCAFMKRLGPTESKERISIKKHESYNKGTFQVQFENGSTHVTLFTREETIISFDLMSKDWERITSKTNPEKPIKVSGAYKKKYEHKKKVGVRVKVGGKKKKRRRKMRLAPKPVP